MAIEHRELPPGAVLAASYKGQVYACEVVLTEQGKRYRLEDGREFRSPSAAGSAVMGGIACNGWRFWKVAGAGDDVATPADARKRRGKRTPSGEQFRKVKNQRGVPEGKERWHCSACMAAFITDAESDPQVCAEGHARIAPEKIRSDD